MSGIVFVEELPEPKKRPAVSGDTVEALKETPGNWGRIAYEGDGLKESTVRSRGVTLRNYANRHGFGDNVQVRERTEDKGLAIYARWVEDGTADDE